MKKIFYSALIVLVGLTACQKENGTDIDVKGSIALAPTIVAPVTRVSLNDDGSGTFTAASEGVAADQIGIYVQSKKTSDETVATVVANDLYTFGATTGNPVYYWENYGTKTLIFSGYYPYQTTVADATAMAVNLAENQTDWLVTGELYKTYADADNTTVDMPFTHAMHNVVVKLENDDPDNATFTADQLGKAKVEVTCKLAGTLNLITGVAAAGTTDATYAIDHASLTDPSPLYSCLVMPQTLGTTAVMVTVTIPANNATSQPIVYTYTPLATDFPAVEGKYAALELKQGYQTTLTFKVSQHDITPNVIVTTQIAAWGTGETVDFTESDENNQNRPAGIYTAAQWSDFCTLYAATYADDDAKLAALQAAKYMDDRGVVRLWNNLVVDKPLTGFVHVLDGQSWSFTGADITTNDDKALVCNLDIKNISLTAANIVNIDAKSSTVYVKKLAINSVFDAASTVEAPETGAFSNCFVASSFTDSNNLFNVGVGKTYYRNSSTEPSTPVNMSKALFKSGFGGSTTGMKTYSSPYGTVILFASWKIGADGDDPEMKRINFTAY